MSKKMKVFALALPIALFLFSSFDCRVPEPHVNSVTKTQCRMVFSGKKGTYKKQVFLNLTQANLTHFAGLPVYYFFYNSAGNLVETASAIVGSNPQVVTVTQLADGVTYGVKPGAVNTVPYQPTMDAYFTGNFKCKLKAQQAVKANTVKQN